MDNKPPDRDTDVKVNRRDRRDLRALLLVGLTSPPSTPVNASYFDALRARVRRHSSGKAD
ncbi:MAG: hypothetical protein ACNA7E_07480 [Wenzhouxiangellaceae bacterium]